MKLLSSSWVVMLLGAVLYLGTTAAVLLKNKGSFQPVVHVATTNAPPANVRGPSWEFFNPDLEDMVKELKEKQESLDQREKDLDAYAARLQAEKDEIGQITRQIDEMRKSLDASVVLIRENEQANLKKLAKNYAQMELDAAVQVMAGLDDITMVKVLMCMKDAESAPILNELARRSEADSKRIARVSERLRLAQQAKPQNP